MSYIADIVVIQSQYYGLKPTAWVDQSAVHFRYRGKADQDQGNIHITQDVVRAISISLDHSCNKYCNLIGQREVSISHRHL